MSDGGGRRFGDRSGRDVIEERRGGDERGRTAIVRRSVSAVSRSTIAARRSWSASTLPLISSTLPKSMLPFGGEYTRVVVDAARFAIGARAGALDRARVAETRAVIFAVCMTFIATLIVSRAVSRERPRVVL